MEAGYTVEYGNHNSYKEGRNGTMVAGYTEEYCNHNS